MNEWRTIRIGEEQHTRAEEEDAGTLVAPTLFGVEYKKRPAQPPSVCVCVCVRAHRLQYIWDMGAAYICQCVSCRPVERGGENWIEWPFVGHCWKNRIARTNTWTSLEKGGNIKGNMMLVCTVDSAWEQEKKTTKNMRIQIDVHIPFLESYAIWFGRVFYSNCWGGNWRNMRGCEWMAIKRQILRRTRAVMGKSFDIKLIRCRLCFSPSLNVESWDSLLFSVLHLSSWNFSKFRIKSHLTYWIVSVRTCIDSPTNRWKLKFER
jgi:hypothetical protein